MVVRSFRLSDYAAVSKLLSDVLSVECCEETMSAFACQLSWDCDLVLVATLDEQIVGVLIGTIDNDRGYFYRIAVDRPYQRRGIGKALIASMKERFQRRKVAKVLVSVDKHNQMILPLYESMGFDKRDFFHSFETLKIVNG